MNLNHKNKKLFDDFEVSVDKEKLWQSVRPAIPQKRERMGWIFPLWGASIVFAVGLTYMLTKKIFLDQNLHASITVSNSNPIINLTNLKTSIAPKQINKEIHLDMSHTYHNKIRNKITQSKLSQALNEVEFSESLHFSGMTNSEGLIPILEEGSSSEVLLTENSLNEFHSLNHPIHIPLLSNKVFPVFEDKNTSEVTMTNASLTHKSSPKQKNHFWMLRMGGGSFQPEFFSNSGDRFYEDNLASSVSGLEYLTADVVLSLYQNRNFSVSTGVQYSRFTTRLSNSSSNTISSEKDGIENTVINLNGESLTNFGRVNTHAFETSNYKWHTVFQHVDWLWDFNYRMALTKKWGLSLHVMPTIQLISWEHGGFIDVEQNLNKIGTGNSPYKSDIFNLNFGGYLTYKLNKDISIMLGSRYNMRKYSMDAYAVDQRVRSMHLNIGLYRAFNY